MILGTVWMRARSLTPLDGILLGLVAWFIPLRMVYSHYVVWAIIPFLMRGQLKPAIIITGLFQAADTISYSSWWPGVSPLSVRDPFLGLVLTSAMYRLVGATVLCFILNSLVKNPKPCSRLNPAEPIVP